MKINANIDNFKRHGKRMFYLYMLGAVLISPTSEGLAEIDSKLETTEPKNMQILDQQSLSDIKNHPDKIMCVVGAIAGALYIYKDIKNTSIKSTKHSKFTKRLSRRRG